LAIGNRQSAIGNPFPTGPWAGAVLFLVILAALATACSRRSYVPQAYLAFVASAGSNSLAVVDLASFRTVASIPVEAGPEQLALRPGKREVYVTAGSGHLSVVGFPELRVLRTLHVGRSICDVRFAADGRQAFVLDPADGQIVFLDCDAWKVVTQVRAAAPLSSLVLAPDGKTLVASSSAANRIFFVDVASRKLLGSLEVGKQPGPMVFAADSSRVYVADTGEEKITVADITSRQVLSHIELGMRPSALVLKPDGGELFVLSAAASTLAIVDASRDNVSQAITTGRQPDRALHCWRWRWLHHHL
jgi:YVTN family beta-propeller protein